MKEICLPLKHEFDIRGFATMTIKEIIALLGDIAAFFISAAALIYSLATLLPRIRGAAQDVDAKREKTDADVSTRYNDLLLSALDRLDKLDERFNALKSENEKLQQELKERDKKLDEWAKGIDMLIKQICTLGQTPLWYPDQKEAEG